MKRFAQFALKVTTAHVLTYFVAGAAAYAFLTHEFYIGQNPIFATFMRTEAEPGLWAHVMRWFLPGQILRGLLLAIALYPFLPTIEGWPFCKRLGSIAGLYLIIGCWAAATASPGTIEGLIYLRPEITMRAHLLVQPEIIVQSVAMAALIAWWLPSGNRKV